MTHRLLSKRLSAVVLVAVSACAGQESPGERAPSTPQAMQPNRVAPVAPSAVGVERGRPDVGIALVLNVNVREASGQLVNVPKGILLGYDGGSAKVATPTGIVEGFIDPVPSERDHRSRHSKAFQQRVVDVSGVGLFVAQEIVLTDSTGEVFLRAQPGAFLDVLSVRGGMADVRVHSPKLPGLTFVVPRASLSFDPLELKSDKPSTDSVDNVRLNFVVNGTKQEALCADPVYLGLPTASALRVSQRYFGVEVFGLASDAGESCGPRTRTVEGAALPEHFERVSPFTSAIFQTKRKFYLEERGSGDGAPVCRAWTFAPGGQQGGTMSMTVKDELDMRQSAQGAFAGELFITSAYHLANALVRLQGPATLEFKAGPSRYHDAKGRTVTNHGYGRGEAVCGSDIWVAIGEDDQGLRVIHGGGLPFNAVDRRDVEHWFTSQEACEKSLPKLADLPLREQLLAGARPRASGCH
jgi:hypothetical protein